MKDGKYVIVKKKTGGIALGIVDSSMLEYIPDYMKKDREIPVRFMPKEMMKYPELRKIAWLVNQVSTASCYKPKDILYTFEDPQNVNVDDMKKLQKKLKKIVLFKNPEIKSDTFLTWRL